MRNSLHDGMNRSLFTNPLAVKLSERLTSRTLLRRYFLTKTLAGAFCCVQAQEAFAYHRKQEHFQQPREHSSEGYAHFLENIYHEAQSQGISSDILKESFALTTRPNPRVLHAERHQAEFTLSWSRYRDRVLTEAKFTQGLNAVRENASLLSSVSALYGVNQGIIAGIWGIESAYGTYMGQFHVIDALATLAYASERSSFFRGELFKALFILNQGTITPKKMLGSYAGAMGQPQFMPSTYLRYAVSYPTRQEQGSDIWYNKGDVFASIAHYLAQCGWKTGDRWGQAVVVPETLPQNQLGRQYIQPISWWKQQGVKPLSGDFLNPEQHAALIRPDGIGGSSFLVYHNFNVIRRYNPSDFYALAVCLLGDALG